MYEVSLSRHAERDLDHLPTRVRDELLRRIARLAENPRPPGCLKMQGSAEWRIRVGQYRVRYLIHDGEQTVVITQAGHRSEAYRD